MASRPAAHSALQPPLPDLPSDQVPKTLEQLVQFINTTYTTTQHPSKFKTWLAPALDKLLPLKLPTGSTSLNNEASGSNSQNADPGAIAPIADQDEEEQMVNASQDETAVSAQLAEMNTGTTDASLQSVPVAVSEDAPMGQPVHSQEDAEGVEAQTPLEDSAPAAVPADLPQAQRVGTEAEVSADMQELNVLNDQVRNRSEPLGPFGPLALYLVYV